MMAYDTRNNSAMSKRAEQLKRWEDSDTNRASNMPKDPSTRKVKFSAGCVFLAACLSGDKEDILRLLENSVDIDTANVDGLTALHQVIIFTLLFFFLFSSISPCLIAAAAAAALPGLPSVFALPFLLLLPLLWPLFFCLPFNKKDIFKCV